MLLETYESKNPLVGLNITKENPRVIVSILTDHYKPYNLPKLGIAENSTWRFRGEGNEISIDILEKVRHSHRAGKYNMIERVVNVRWKHLEVGDIQNLCR